MEAEGPLLFIYIAMKGIEAHRGTLLQDDGTTSPGYDPTFFLIN